MITYWILFVGLLPLVLFDFLKIRDDDEYLVFSTALLILGFFAGLRYECDADYKEYVTIFNLVPSSWNYILNPREYEYIHGEKGFLVLCALLKDLGGRPQSLFLIVSIINMYFMGKVIRLLSPYKFSSLILYVGLFYLGGGFTQIRFGMGYAIGFVSLYYLFSGRQAMFFIVLFIGSLFHTSVLMYLVVYFFSLFNISKVSIVTYGTILTFFLFLAMLDLTDFLITTLGPLIVDSAGYYENYLYQEEYLTKANVSGLILNAFLTICFYIVKSGKEWSRKDQLLFSLCLLSIVIGGIVIHVNILARLTIIFQIVFIIVIPEILYSVRFRLVGMIVLVLYSAFRFSQYLKPNGFIFPYQTVFITI